MARGWTDEELKAAAEVSQTVADVCRALGIQPRGGNYQVVWRHLRRLGLQVNRPRPRVDDEAFAKAVAESKTFAEVARRVGAASPSRIRARIDGMGLDAAHFRGQGWRRGTKGALVPRRPLQEILRADCFVQGSTLRERLIREGLKEHRCEICGLAEWNGSATPLELDHINGRRDDNRLENLRLICPNCHAQTPTYRGRNIGRYTQAS